MKITEQEQAERKKRIIQAAYELFYDRGIDSVSLKEVAKRAGISLNTIFRYFGTKAVLLGSTQKILWEEMMNQVLHDSEEQLRCARSGLEEMEVLLSNFQGLYQQHSNYLLFACEYKLYLVRQHIQLTAQLYNEMLHPVHETFICALNRGHEDGSISKSETAERQFLTLWGVMRSFVEQAVVYERMLEGSNPWWDQFDQVLRYALQALEPVHLQEQGGITMT